MPRSKIYSLQIVPNRSTSLASCVYSIPDTASSYVWTPRTATSARHVETCVLLASHHQRRLQHDHQTQSLRTRREFTPPEATITTLFSICTTQLYFEEFTKTIAKNRSRLPVHFRHDRSVLQTNKSYAHFQIIIYTHGKHLYH